MKRKNNTSPNSIKFAAGILLGSTLFFATTAVLAQVIITTPEEEVTISATVPSDIFATIQWAVPELRVGAVETNDDMTFFLTVRTSDDSDDVILFTQNALATTDTDGTYSTPIELTIPAGTYNGQTEPANGMRIVTTAMSCDVSLDADIVYELIKTLGENAHRIAEYVPYGEHITPKFMYELAPVLDKSEFHPGALKYYSEKGFIN